MKPNFSDVLDDLLLEKNITLSDLSRNINMDYKQLANYTKGRYSPSLKSAIKIAQYFECSLDYLCGLNINKGASVYSEPDFLFYDRYKQILEDRKISHYKLCKDTGINVNVLRLWKSGKIPTLFNLIKIADYLGVSIDYLIGRTNTK